MPSATKAKVKKLQPRPLVSKRVDDLESYVSDNSAHLADLEVRLNTLKSGTVNSLSKRVGDLESRTSDLIAHLADLETRLTEMRRRLRE